MSSKGLVTVTGASGFIALHTIKKLLEKGYTVRGTLRDANRIGQLVFSLSRHCDVSGLGFVEADLNDDAGWDEAMDGALYLLHM
ncbi:MAG: NAD-dependent epimerase/dehydratase family protein, partial [Sneathiella sp.]|nr:NAD-dependent epimerase/dehydratase family protein [Sneathiella sp.]